METQNEIDINALLDQVGNRKGFKFITKEGEKNSDELFIEINDVEYYVEKYIEVSDEEPSNFMEILSVGLEEHSETPSPSDGGVYAEFEADRFVDRWNEQ